MEPTECNPIDKVAKESFGIDYLFPYQRLVVSNILEGRDQIVILPTGAGKSLCFSVPAAFFDGPTLIIFPLLALMSDQARRLESTGMGVASLRGGQPADERERVWRRCEQGQIKYLISNPETLIQPKVLDRLKELHISHMVIDEAHTVCEWGESFRPSYLKLPEIRKQAAIPQVTAFTATASDYVLDRLRDIVFVDESPHLVKAVPDRPNIGYSVIPVLSKDYQIRRLVTEAQRPTIIFCRSRTSAELTARNLAKEVPDLDCRFYHAGLSREEKSSVEKWFFDSDDAVLASTCAYGMGVDKGNIRTVIHRDLPPSVEAYLQESGRAGRDRQPAEAVLLFSPADWSKGSVTKDSTASARFRAMLGFVADGKRCRREYLLSLLSAEPEACFGCDVCRGELIKEPEGLGEVLRLLSRYRKTLKPEDVARILTGRTNEEVVLQGHHRYRGFAALDGWRCAEVDEAIETVRDAHLIKTLRRGSRKGRLALSNKRSYAGSLKRRLSLF